MDTALKRILFQRFPYQYWFCFLTYTYRESAVIVILTYVQFAVDVLDLRSSVSKKVVQNKFI